MDRVVQLRERMAWKCTRSAPNGNVPRRAINKGPCLRPKACRKPRRL